VPFYLEEGDQDTIKQRGEEAKEGEPYPFDPACDDCRACAEGRDTFVIRASRLWLHAAEYATPEGIFRSNPPAWAKV